METKLRLKKETVEVLESRVNGFGGAGTNQINSKAAGTVCISCDRVCGESNGQEFCPSPPVLSATCPINTCDCPGVSRVCETALCQTEFAKCKSLSCDLAASVCICYTTDL